MDSQTKTRKSRKRRQKSANSKRKRNLKRRLKRKEFKKSMIEAIVKNEKPTIDKLNKMELTSTTIDSIIVQSVEPAVSSDRSNMVKRKRHRSAAQIKKRNSRTLRNRRRVNKARQAREDQQEHQMLNSVVKI